MGSKVYFTREITPQAVVRLYHELGIELPGRVAVKVHSGKGKSNFSASGVLKPMVEEVRHDRGVQYCLWRCHSGCGIIQNPTKTDG